MVIEFLKIIISICRLSLAKKNSYSESNKMSEYVVYLKMMKLSSINLRMKIICVCMAKLPVQQLV